MSDNEESRITQIAWVRESLREMSKAYLGYTERADGVIHLLTAIRHYCDFYDLSFEVCDNAAKECWKNEQT